MQKDKMYLVNSKINPNLNLGILKVLLMDKFRSDYFSYYILDNSLFILYNSMVFEINSSTEAGIPKLIYIVGDKLFYRSIKIKKDGKFYKTMKCIFLMLFNTNGKIFNKLKNMYEKYQTNKIEKLLKTNPSAFNEDFIILNAKA